MREIHRGLWGGPGETVERQELRPLSLCTTTEDQTSIGGAGVVSQRSVEESDGARGGRGDEGWEVVVV